MRLAEPGQEPSRAKPCVASGVGYWWECLAHSISSSWTHADEAALYDRQIRLWGLEAQGRIRKAHVVVLNLDGLTTEAVKNWVLAGIARLTLVDARPTVQEHDLAAGFFWRSEDIGGEVRGLADHVLLDDALTNGLFFLGIVATSTCGGANTGPQPIGTH